MNYWQEGNHQQPNPGGPEMPPWLPGALFFGALVAIVVVVAVFRWVL